MKTLTLPANVRDIAGDRDATIALIKANLKARSKTPWSVTGGKGTAWGWITIDVAPRLRDECGCMKDEHRHELADLLGKERMHMQGESIPSSRDYRQEMIERSAGLTPTVEGTPYWD